MLEYYIVWFNLFEFPNHVTISFMKITHAPKIKVSYVSNQSIFWKYYKLKISILDFATLSGTSRNMFQSISVFANILNYTF